MKKFIYLLSFLFLLFGTCAYAQHKPLKPIELNSVYISQSGAEKSYNIGKTREIYKSYFYLGSHSISHQKGIKDYDLGYESWNVDFVLDNNEAIALNIYTAKSEQFTNFHAGLTCLKIVVGEATYDVNTWYYSEATSTHRYLMMDINKSIAEHISVSGLQGIIVNNIEIIAFSEIEQELWKRAAKDVYDTLKNL